MTILVVAGDPSGDLHGSHLIAALKKADPSCRLAAVGGPLMRQKADEFLEDLASQGVTGFWEPIGKLGFLTRLAWKLKGFMTERKPSALVCIDYYGFNRRLLSLAKSCEIPAYYYIGPQVWASRPGRIGVLSRLVRKMFVIFPFETELYTKAGLPCLFVGHPLLDILSTPVMKRGIKAPLQVGLLPGSRVSEVRRHLPVLLNAAQALRRHFPHLQVSVFASPGLPDSAYAIGKEEFELVRELDYRRRLNLDIALSCSGTATLENALLGIPMVVVYKLSWITYAVARAIIRVPYISMVNILAGRKLVPELIQNHATPDSIAEAAKQILENPKKYQSLKENLLSLRKTLGYPGAATRTAEALLKEISARSV